ncbi:MAG: DUF2946 family protein [Gammaproteobacteria bacterium]
MDEMVKAAMAKWPQVPACYGWLGLDARGTWYMRDDRTQAAGPFAPEPGQTMRAAKGSALQHDKLIAFIHRNYLPDDQGRWFFQNGPQRVFVELELTPLIWRLQPDGHIQAHTGVDAGAVQRCLLDEAGRLYLQTARGLGLVHTADMDSAADRVEHGEWVPEEIRSEDLERLGGFIRSPLQVQQPRSPA